MESVSDFFKPSKLSVACDGASNEADKRKLFASVGHVLPVLQEFDEAICSTKDDKSGQDSDSVCKHPFVEASKTLMAPLILL